MASLGVPNSNGEPGGEPPTTPQGDLLLDLQRKDEVRDVAQSVNLYDEPGFGKVAVDLDAREVYVYWKGSPPRAVLSKVGTQVNGIAVILTSVRYSDADLTAAGEELFRAGRQPGGVRMMGVHRKPDMSGLIAEVAPADLQELRASRSRSPGRTVINHRLTDIAEVPVTSRVGYGVFSTSRQNDSPPWQGGGAMRWPEIEDMYCTTGFALITSSGAGRLLSAAHCDPSGDEEIRDGANAQTISGGGSAVDVRHKDIDSMIINPAASPGTIGKVFGGAFDQPSGTLDYEYHVGGSAVPLEHDEVCISGANSGEHCNKEIKELSYQFDCPGNVVETCSGFVFGNITGTSVTVAQGDSGAPVYVERTDDRVGARGIQSVGLIEFETDCPTVADNWPRVRCSRRGVAVGIHRILDYWNDHGHSGVHVEFD